MYVVGWMYHIAKNLDWVEDIHRDITGLILQKTGVYMDTFDSKKASKFSVFLRGICVEEGFHSTEVSFSCYLWDFTYHQRACLTL